MCPDCGLIGGAHKPGCMQAGGRHVPAHAKDISTLRALVLVALFLSGIDTVLLIFVADFVAKIDGILRQLGG